MSVDGDDSIASAAERALRSADNELPMFDDEGKPITYRIDAHGARTSLPLVKQDVIIAEHYPDVLLAMSEAEKAAHLEFKAAAQEARATQEAAQRAAKRYADAVRRLSEVCAPPSIAPRGDGHD